MKSERHPAAPEPVNCTVRPMEEADWPAVREIYLEGIRTGRATFETEAPPYSRWDAAHLKACRLVAEDERGRVLGWVALSPVSARECYRGVAELSVYVAADSRGRQVGTALLDIAAVASEEAGVWTLQSTVLAPNAASVALHKKCGFRVVGRRERHARDASGVWRDTILMERRSSRIGV